MQGILSHCLSHLAEGEICLAKAGRCILSEIFLTSGRPVNINPADFQKIVILTGAGISAESGIATFRDSNGLWEQHRIEDVATPEAFARDPHLVWRFYSLRRFNAAQAKPNPAHLSLVNYARSSGKTISLVTQNVDVLHQRADQTKILATICMHGSLEQSRCEGCEKIFFDDFAYFDLNGKYNPKSTLLCANEQINGPNYLHRRPIDYLDELPLSPCCRKLIRPHIVWFGEIPMQMDQITGLIQQCDLFVSVGTSGQVYPAAGFLQMAKLSGATTVSINKDPLSHRAHIDQFLEGPAGGRCRSL